MTLHFDYKGMLKEILFLPPSFFIINRHIEKKFIIFGLPRSGTTLLVSLLNHHPSIHCDGELWAHKLISPMRYVKNRSKFCTKIVYGFKLLVTHFEKQNFLDPKETITKFTHSGYQVIYLTRKNLYRAALSNLYANYLGSFHLTNSKSKNRIMTFEKMRIDPSSVLERLERFEYLSELQAKAIQGINHLELFYEDDLKAVSSQQLTVDRICDFLGIERAEVGTNQMRVTADKTNSFIENALEIEEFIRNSKYSKFLDSE